MVQTPGIPIPEAFPPGDPVARFVVAMCMPRNDLVRALTDVRASETRTDGANRYRICAMFGHLFEAIEAMGAWRSTYTEIQEFMQALPEEARQQLHNVESFMNKVGRDPLSEIRNNTFHYPRPSKRRDPDSDYLLEGALHQLHDRGAALGQGTHGNDVAQIFTFADDAQLMMTTRVWANAGLGGFDSLGDCTTDFIQWTHAVMRLYEETHGIQFDMDSPPTTSD